MALSIGLWGSTAIAATLLPNGKQQFTDANGAPYAGGTVCFYIPNTTTPKTTWQDALETTPNASPCITLDSAGRAIIYGTGQYREKLFDVNSNLVWDQLTQDPAALVPYYYGGTSTGSANAQTITLSGSTQPQALSTGQLYTFLPGFANTSAATLVVATSQSTFASAAIKKPTGSGLAALVGGELQANTPVTVLYDGTNFDLQSAQYGSSTASFLTGPTTPTSGDIAVWTGSPTVLGDGGTIKFTGSQAVRQTVLSGATTSGTPSLLSAGSGLAVNLLATATPVEIAFANGFGATGAKDDVYQWTADVTSAWSGLTDNTTDYLYVNYNGGSPTFGFSTLAPVYQPTAPTSPATGQDWFSTSTYQMEDWNGSAWVAVERVYVGEATTAIGQLIASNGPAGTAGTTSPAINDIGANLDIVGVACASISGVGVSDNASNTFTKAVGTTNGSNPGTAIFYVSNPTTSASHTFSITGTCADAVIMVEAWSGAATSSPLDQTAASSTASNSPIAPGSVTPTQNNEILAAAASNISGSGNNVTSITAGFTLSSNVPGGGANNAAALAYLLQTTAAAVNPSFTFSVANTSTAAIATFKSSGGIVTGIRDYAYQGQYVSGWTATLPGTATAVSFNDNIGTSLKNCQFEIENLTTEGGYAVGDVVQTLLTDAGGSWVSLTPWVEANTSGITTGSSAGLAVVNKSTGALFEPMTAANWAYRMVCNRSFR